MAHQRQFSVRTVTLSAVVGALGAFLVALPAEASRLQFWRLNPTSNQIEIRTEAGVQPRAELVYGPTRLVIDLPGVVLGRPQINQDFNGPIRQVRVAQFNPQVTRIVVEYAEGYTIDPQAVQFRGFAANNWMVQLPTPQRVQATPTASTPAAQTTTTPSRTTSPTELLSWRGDSTGIFVATSGGEPQVASINRRNPTRIEITLNNANISNRFSNRRLELTRFSIGRVRADLRGQRGRPPQVVLTLNVDRNSPDWQVNTNVSGGFMVMPRNIATNTPQAQAASATTPPASSTNQQPRATVQRIDLGGSELLIQGDRTLFYSVGWEGPTYRIRLRSAQLGNIQEPRLAAGSPLSKVEFRREDDQTVSILLTPAQGVRILNPRHINAESFIVPLQRSGAAVATSPSPGTTPINVPRPTAPAPGTTPVPSGRYVVVIDPGHGGRDPGAVGIGGIREKDIVLDISNKVAQYLQQQGVQVIMTRTSDQELDLAPRVSIAERARANAFVSIHANAISMSRPDVNGFETYYAPGRSSRLASAIQNSVLSSINIRDRGVRTARFYVIRNTSMDSALVETGFVTGAEDAANFQNPAWRSRMAEAIGRGIMQYLRFGG